jgi:uncharacterized protein YecE (DUF72 family)
VAREGRVRVGCSGWQYEDWRGRFYPAGLPRTRWLPHYASVFETVEVNNTFYRLPETETFAAWRAATPVGFLIAVKASRFLTHLKQLRDPEPPLALLFSRALALGSRLGPVLYQLPARLQYDADRLRRFLDALPRRPGDVETGRTGAPVPRGLLRHAIEFRHPSWYRDDVFRWIAEANATVCVHDKADSRFEDVGVGPFAYVRFHGTSGHYHGSYPRRALEAWAARLAAAVAAGRDVYAYFNNDAGGAAVRNARTLRDLSPVGT